VQHSADGRGGANPQIIAGLTAQRSVSRLQAANEQDRLKAGHQTDLRAAQFFISRPAFLRHDGFELWANAAKRANAPCNFCFSTI
jgi:hypothetical protein